MNLISSGSSIRRVKRMTLITPSKDELLLSLYFTSPGFDRIRCTNFRSACQPGKQYRPFQRGGKTLNNGCYIPKLKNMRWWFQHSSKIWNSWADYVDGFIRVLKQMNKMHHVPVGAIVGPEHLMCENAASGGIDSVWLANNHVDLDTY